ncbi:ABC-type multidrug transport system, ATPase and permease component [Owenweeksia hongkongensis DSM 17368]|uniref:ABC-type multidrug transport system, ATPase and permease component n=1 Tax=Owenweeksia hongkongensis (strain DSM 17368 / CIP 108786 / JCM 12287 / NRRL B-23963 / UST20020801) TaxID=926562 RepID=G8R2S4_OWEHD|nr:ABC transporter ATP-binding protein [Owenweeksia hongkongensis]AEV31879.1 ABC-type multidrug transport system, ATPase and permease component [Owenweeksia hongkongensis DSM 17368]
MKSLKVLNKYFYKYRGRLLLGVLFVTISVIFGVFPAQFVRESFDTVQVAIDRYNSPTGNTDMGELRSKLIMYGLIIIGASLLKGLFMFFMRQTIIVVSRFIEYDMKNEIFDQYQKLSLAFYKRNNTGDLMNRISEDVSRVRMYLGPAIMYTINVGLSLIIIISIMLTINVRLTLYALAPLPILAVAIYYVSAMINVKSEQVQRQLSSITSFVQEAFSGIRVLKAYVREAHSRKEFRKEADTYLEKNEELYRINSLFFPLMLLLIGMSTIFTIYIGGQEAIKGNITTGNIAEFIIYVNMLTWPVASIGWVTSLVQRAAASQTRINEFLKITPEIENPTTEPLDLKGKIEFKNVSFTYPDTGIKAMNNVSFTIEEGQSLAVIGKTGSGKSTIASLIGRLYDVTEGEILIDDKNIKQINLSDLRKSIGYVPQEAFLFSSTIAKNIGFGLENASEEVVINAAKNAEVHHNIVDFPQGYETRVGERGITLSGGQKQRVSIARAIIKEPKLMIFDDCLSAVDTETEEKILGNLKRLIDKRTTLIISHRVSSVKHADSILVLDNGAIIEKGTHDELMEKDGYYKMMYEQQLIEDSKKAV